jgi:GWxTD domain-containing protein
MTFLDALVRTASAKAVGWTLVHSLWEGAAIALLLAFVLAIARSSRVRYAAACFAMLALLTGFAVTLYRLMPRQTSRSAAVLLPVPVKPSIDNRPVANHRSLSDASELLPWLAPAWLAGVLLFQLRCLASWAAAGRLRRIGVCGASQQWTEKLDELRGRLRMAKAVTLLESCFAEVPVVIGHLRPVVLMPVGLLAGLPAGQIEAILLHELAHIRRADYLVNLMQTLVEGLLFYHPAAWWISSTIRTERENCCDDLVVLTNGDAHEYATALAALAENRWIIQDAVIAATGGNLVKRIRRMLAQPEGPRTTIAPVLSVGILILTGAAALTAWQTPARPVLVAQAQSAPEANRSKYDKWLKEDVVYIITDRERAEFKSLRTDAERDHFIEQFWARRDPTPGTPENEFKDEHYRRIAYANGRFTISALPGWKTDRGRIYIQYGPPDEIDSHPSGGAYTRESEQGGGQTVTYPFEQWRYRFIEGIGNSVILEFVDKAKTGDYRLTMDPAEKEQVLIEKVRRAVADQMASVPPPRELIEEATREQLQKQVEMAARQLRDLADSVPPPHLDQLESQAQVEQIRQELEKAQENMRDVEDRISPAQRDLLESEAQRQREIEGLEKLLRSQEQAAPHESSIFLSGSGPQAVVAILPNHQVRVTIPLEFPAEQYSISVTAISSDGTTVWSNHAEANRGNTNSVTVGAPVLAPGSYRLTAAVTDRAGSKQKTYVVNFTVN